MLYRSLSGRAAVASVAVAVAAALATPGTAGALTSAPSLVARAAATASGPGSSSGSKSPTPSLPVPLSGVTTAVSSSAAATLAKSSNAPVEDLSERQDASSTFVLPSGSRVRRFWTKPVHTLQNGKWVDVSTSLIKSAKGWAPQASDFPLSVGAGGAGSSIVSTQLGPDAFSIGWSGTLPASTASGSTATFSAVAPGENVSVTADDQSAEFSTILTSRPSSPLVLRFPLSGNGLSYVPEAGGALQIWDSRHNLVGELSAPIMYDAHSGHPDDFTLHQGQISMSVDTSGSSPVLVLTPDNSWLQDPSTSYPVTIDPTLYASNAADVEGTYVYGDQNDDGLGGNAGELYTLGYMDIGRLDSVHKGVGYLKFLDINPADIPGTVRDATLNIYQYYSGDTKNQCTDTSLTPPTGTGWNPVDLYTDNDVPSGNGWDQSTIKWTNQPSANTLAAPLDYNFNTSGNGSCAANWTQFIGLGSSVTSWLSVQNQGFILKANDPTLATGHRSYYTGQRGSPAPYLDVTYSAYPVVTSPGISIISSPNQSYSSLTPTLSAQILDPDQSPVSTVDARFDVYDASNNAAVFPIGSDNPNSAAAGSDASVQLTLPPGRLTNGHSYYYVVTPYYVDSYGQVINPQKTQSDNFTVDSQAPTAPTITSPITPNSWIQPDNSPSAGYLSQAQFQFAATDDNYVADYRVSLDNGSWSAPLNANSYSWTSISSGQHTLSVQSEDEAGNWSTSTSETFGVGLGSVGANRTWKNILLTPSGSPDKTSVTYSWAVPNATPAWSQLPTTDVTYGGSQDPSCSVTTGAAIGGWGVSACATHGTFPKMVWNVAKTFQTLGKSFGGLILVQACYASSGPQQCVWQPVQLDKSPFGGAYATANLGVGVLAETTGDFDVTAQDVSVPGYADNLTFGRDATTLHPGGIGASEQLTTQQQGLEGSSPIAASDYTASAATISQSTAHAFSGSNSLLVTNNSTSNDSYATLGSDTSVLEQGMLPGLTYTASGHIFVPSGTTNNNSARGLRLVAVWAEPNGRGGSAVSNAATATNAWSKESVTFTLPTDATGATIRLYNGAANGQSVYWDAMGLRQATTGVTQATRILGPGWIADLPGASQGDSQDSVTDNTNTTGYVILTDAIGETTSYEYTGTVGQAVCTSTSPCSYFGISQAAYDGSTLTESTTDNTNTVQEITLTEADGSKTVWTRPVVSTPSSLDTGWQVATATGPGAHDNISYLYDGSGRVTDAYSANPATSGGTTPINCSPVTTDPTARGLVPGCRDLVLNYSPDATPIPSGGSTGAYPGQLAEVDYYAFDPHNPTSVVKTPVAQYAYDSSGHLRAEWDPRISPVLKTTYSYDTPDANGVSALPTARLVNVSPPGVAATTLAYNSAGQLTSSSYTVAGQTSTTSIVYSVPVNQPFNPTNDTQDLPEIDASTAPAWGQGGNPADLPVTATAIFRPDHLPTLTGGVPAETDWYYATLTYMNNDGRATNTANYGTSNYGNTPGNVPVTRTGWEINTTWYDEFSGNVLGTLSPMNRDHAITTGLPGADGYVDSQPTSALRAALLKTTNTYSPDGTNLIKTVGPMHYGQTPSQTGKVHFQTETDNTYDQNAPGGSTSYHLLTTAQTGALIPTVSGVQDIRTTTTGYEAAAGDGSGWVLRLPTSVTSGDSTTTTRYDLDGRVIESRLPASAGQTNVASTTVNEYYTADTSATDPDCQSKPAYAGWICKTFAGARTAGTGPALPVNWNTAYNQWGTVLSSISYSCTSQLSSSCSGAPSRTVTTSFAASPSTDPRPVSVQTTTANEQTTPVNETSAAVPTQYFSYDPSTGLQNCVATSPTACSAAVSSFASSGTPTVGVVLTNYDADGRVAATTDGEGAVTDTSYDVDGRVSKVRECAGVDPTIGTCGSTAYSSEVDYFYDGNAGEHRGLLTSENTHLGSNPSIFSATYDANGNLASETYPNNTVKTISHDSDGNTTDDSLNFNGTIEDYSATPDAFGETVQAKSPLSNEIYSYDQDGRLSQVQDYDSSLNPDGNDETTRNYTYNADSDRLTATLGTPYDQLVKNDGPASYWRLDEPTGTATAADASGNGRVGTYSGGVTHGVTGATPGDVSAGVTVTSAGTGRVSSPAASWNEDAGSFTDEVWFTPPTNAASWPSIMGQGHTTSGAPGWEIDYAPGGEICEDFNAGSIYHCATVPAAANSGWHLLDVTYDASSKTLSLYVDGKIANTYVLSSSISNTDTSDPFTLGTGGPSGVNDTYYGNLDELALYTKTLTADQISEHFQTAQMGVVVEGSASSPRQYDAADRLVDTDYSYDAFGRTLTVPSSDANNAGKMTLTYYADDLVRSEAQGSQSETYSLDPLERVDVTTHATSGATTSTSTQHYASDDSDGSEAASWIAVTSGGASTWSRNVNGIDGTLAATLTSAGVATLDYTNIQGSIVASSSDVANSGPSMNAESLEFGQVRPGASTSPGSPTVATGTGPDSYGWLGGDARDEDSLGGLTLMGERLYDPSSGRFLQTDPKPGGSCNNYDYVCQDPITGSDLSGQCAIKCLVKGVVKVAKAVNRFVEKASKWTWNNRGTVVSIVAAVGCATQPEICIGATIFAAGVRIQSRGIQNGNITLSIIDAAGTALSATLVGASAEAFESEMEEAVEGNPAAKAAVSDAVNAARGHAAVADIITGLLPSESKPAAPVTSAAPARSHGCGRCI